MKTKAQHSQEKSNLETPNKKQNSSDIHSQEQLGKSEKTPTMD